MDIKNPIKSNKLLVSLANKPYCGSGLNTLGYRSSVDKQLSKEEVANLWKKQAINKNNFGGVIE